MTDDILRLRDALTGDSEESLLREKLTQESERMKIRQSLDQSGEYRMPTPSGTIVIRSTAH